MTGDREGWVEGRNAALLTDLYELTMLQAYWGAGMRDEAVFGLHFRRLPPRRNFVVAAGLGTVLDMLETVRFPPEGIDYLAGRGFAPAFLDWLAEFRFRGDVYAVAEGTPVFAHEPILEVVAPIPEAQLVETFVMNQIHLQSVLASKAARVVHAARGRGVVDFGLRRMHGADAGLRAARAFAIAGVDATSNVLAGMIYGVPVSGTVAHSFIEACGDEREAFRRFADAWPETTLLVDTYDTLEGVRNVIRLARERGAEFRVRAIRLDSGDLAELAIQARRILDEAGLRDVRIFASGGLDEWTIARLIDAGAPIDAFGVGTEMGVSADSPTLDLAYKLAAYGGQGRVKTSPGKRTLPGRKQVFRRVEGGRAVGDTIAALEETPPGRPLLTQVMRGGKRLDTATRSLPEMREHCRAELAALPDAVTALEESATPYPVEISALLRTRRDAIAEHWRSAQRGSGS